MKNVAVFYHKADLDGLMSGVIAKYYLTPRFNVVDLIPINYNDDFESALPHQATFYEDIYIIDVSDAKFMEKYGSKIIYIDHHKWAMDTMPKVKDRHCIDGVAACRLAFDYLAGGPDYVFHNKEHFVDRVNPLEPLCVAILGEFDIWDKTSPLAEKLNYGQDLRFNSVEFLFNQTKGICVGDVGELLGPANKKMDVDFLERSKNISELYRDFSYLHYIVTKGEGAIEYVKTAVERIKPKKITIDGYEGVYINTSIDPSLVGMCYQLRDEDQFVMTWHLNNSDNKPSCSFRSSKIDVSQIARKYGGGGHKAAAACKMSLSQLFEIIKPEF
jgi:oligoribonuclease NrnB/cAMP/cGMP phosphodiesterase (DHH superfamily)